MQAAEDAQRRPLRADAARNRSRILETAETVLATEGLQTPIDEIAQRAGVGIGTVYRHFPTKEALYEAVVVGRLQRLVDRADELGRADDPGPAFFEFFAEWVAAGAASKALADSLASAGVDVMAATAELKQALRDRLNRLLVRAQEAGAVRDDVRIDDLMSLLAGACLAVNHSGFDPEARTRMLTVVCDGLRVSAPRPAARRDRAR